MLGTRPGNVFCSPNFGRGVLNKVGEQRRCRALGRHLGHQPSGGASGLAPVVEYGGSWAYLWSRYCDVDV